jgi:transcription elongation factor Elf1
MGRRRRQTVKIYRRKLPELYLCPRCGKNTVASIINKKNDKATVICSNCKLKSSFTLKSQMAAVDAYCIFVDNYYKPQKEEKALIDYNY